MNLEIEGSLSLGPGKHCSNSEGVPSGPIHKLALQDKNKAPKAEAGFFEQTVESPGAFEVLPFPGNLLATVTYIQTLDSAEFIIRYTYADATTDEVAQLGMSLIEHNPDNAVTGLAAKGSGKLRWLATGPLA